MGDISYPPIVHLIAYSMGIPVFLAQKLIDIKRDYERGKWGGTAVHT